MHLGLRFWVMSVAAITIAGSACNVEPDMQMGFNDDDPCYALQGDLTCQSLFGSLPYCSLCATENRGCVMQPPAAVCQPDGGTTTEPERPPEDSSSSSGDMVDTTLAIDDTGSTTGEPPCEMEGMVDPDCMELDATRPFCIDSVCVGCELAGGDSFCGGLDAQSPACNVEEGACVACADADEPVCLDETPVCDQSGACLACTAHEQCPDTACHLSPNDPLQGYCFAPDEVLWVDADAPCPGFGTQDEPACSLQDTAALILPGDNRVIRVLGGSPYAERAMFSGEMTVAIIGVGYPQITGNPGQQAATLLLEDGVTAYVDGLQLLNNALTHGVTCNDSELHVQQTHIRDNDGWGVFNFDACTLAMDRTVVAGNEDGGVRVNGGQLDLVNTTVGLNGIGGNSTGVRAQNVDVHILYSTVAGNDGVSSDSLQCTNATGSLRNSIFTGLDGLSVSLDCFPLMMEHNALDAANFASGTNVEVEAYNEIFYNNPAVGDFTLSAPPLTPFGDVALWLEGDPELDADGTMRPIDGSPGFVGVDEP